MDRQTAVAALQFLRRTNLTGAEVDAFQQVIGALTNIARGAVVVPAANANGEREAAE
jgi:hypothetical protein